MRKSLFKKLWVLVLKTLGFSEHTSGREFVQTILLAGLVAVGVRTFVVEPFKIPSGSMHPTLIEGDFLIVNKWSYGYSQYSFPFNLKLFEGGLFFSAPKRGEVVVFKPPHNTDEWWIKRIIGLPGDRLSLKDGVLYVNQKAVEIELQEPYRLEMWGDSKGPRLVDHYREYLPDSAPHQMIHEGPLGTHALDHMQEIVVPEGHYFVMGDNRCHSSDSRVFGGLGLIPQDYLVGKASLVFFSTDAKLWEIWRWPVAIRYHRLFRWIH